MNGCGEAFANAGKRWSYLNIPSAWRGSTTIPKQGELPVQATELKCPSNPEVKGESRAISLEFSSLGDGEGKRSRETNERSSHQETTEDLVV